jgi:hypothetical protein
LGGVSWHWLRHANATLLDAVGTPLGTGQALLGHSSSEITREVYLHSIPADARTAVEKVEEMLNRPKLTRPLLRTSRYEITRSPHKPHGKICLIHRDVRCMISPRQEFVYGY